MSFKLCSAGDIMLGENTHHFRRGIPARFAGCFDRLIHPEVLNIINSSDVFFANFECSLIPDAERAVAGLERAAYAAPDTALALFDTIRPPVVLNVANNHFGQHGAAVADDTIQKLEARGILCIGRDAEPQILLLGDRRLVCWGVSAVKSKNPAKTCLEIAPERVIDELHWPEKNPEDTWVLSIHWGQEYLTLPDARQKKLAEQLVRKGVDIILGHHPHVIQPVQEIGNSTVCYSHGNFIFDQNFSRQTQEGLLCRITPDSRESEMFLTRQRNYTVYMQQTAEHWLSVYCKKNFSKRLPLLMRVLMKQELLFHAAQSNKETLRYFYNSFRAKLKRTKCTSF